MVHVGQMRKLRTLVLNCDITDTGLETLSELTNLEQLDLTQSKITDAGMVYLKNFAKLKTLILNGTQITNESLSDACRAEDPGESLPRQHVHR